MSIVYLPPRLGISLSAAMAEAYVHSTAGDPELLTIALYHPTFLADDNATPIAIYIVNDFQELKATLEVDARINAGEEVTFLPIPFTFTRPDEADGSSPEVSLDIDNASREIVPYLKMASKSPDQIEVVVRLYLPSDTSAPHEIPPMNLTIKSASATVTTVSCKAGYGDLGNRKFPKVEYTRVSHPALVAA